MAIVSMAGMVNKAGNITQFVPSPSGSPQTDDSARFTFDPPSSGDTMDVRLWTLTINETPTPDWMTSDVKVQLFIDCMIREWCLILANEDVVLHSGRLVMNDTTGLYLGHMGFKGVIVQHFGTANYIDDADRQVYEGGTVGALLSNLAARGRSCRSAHAANASMPGVSLSGADLTGARFDNVDLTGVDLSGADLTGVNFTGANLTDEAIPGASLVGADLTDATLDNVDLTDTDLTDAVISGISLVGANLSGVNLTNVNLAGANLKEVNLTGVDLTGMDLTGTDLTGADLSGTNLDGVNLAGANLTGAVTVAKQPGDRVPPGSIGQGGGLVPDVTP